MIAQGVCRSGVCVAANVRAASRLPHGVIAPVRGKPHRLQHRAAEDLFDRFVVGILEDAERGVADPLRKFDVSKAPHAGNSDARIGDFRRADLHVGLAITRSHCAR